MPPKINLVTLSAAEVAANEDNYNSSFHNASEAPHFLPSPPSELPTRFAPHLPLILSSQGLPPSAVQTIHLTHPQCRLLLQASTASLHTRVLNRVYLDDLKDELTPSFTPLIFPPQGLFLRLSACSPKDGEGGTSPLRTIEDIYLRLTTSYRACNSIQRALDKDGEKYSKLELFFLPFDGGMDTSFEYRVFCAPALTSRFSPGRSNGEVVEISPPSSSNLLPPPPKIAAISQYRWHKPSSLSPLLPTSSPTFQQTIALITSEALRIHGLIIAAAIERSQSRETTKDKGVVDLNMHTGLGSDINLDHLLFSQGFVFDIRFIQEKTLEGGKEDAGEVKGRCELIELNTFGTLSACGACLFHWLRDERVLYGLNGSEGEEEGEGDIEFRISI